MSGPTKPTKNESTHHTQSFPKDVTVLFRIKALVYIKYLTTYVYFYGLISNSTSWRVHSIETLIVVNELRRNDQITSLEGLAGLLFRAAMTV